MSRQRIKGLAFGETQGVSVVSYQTDDFPAFFSAASKHKISSVAHCSGAVGPPSSPSTISDHVHLLISTIRGRRWV
ncbi:hypothetical protein QVD17_41404 [Tagetes erecta]|uniref:Uncharacterized protein n=1 Tax=Tagetes erecta TaxID=13708 RepID=A0AAD8JKE1_TARER|nr:hypothetical protein QVD17_41404 [Tagetes erecta]